MISFMTCKNGKPLGSWPFPGPQERIMAAGWPLLLAYRDGEPPKPQVERPLPQNLVHRLI